VDCDEAIGRYVVVDLPGDNKQLTLCEVQISGAFTTPAFSKCKQSAEAIEADLEKVKADEKAAKTEIAKLKVDHGDLVKKLNDDLLQARSDEAGTKKDAHAAAGDANDAALVSKSSHDDAMAAKDEDIAKFKADAAASAKQKAEIDGKRQAAEDAHAATQAACTKKKMEDATMIEDLKKTHTEAAKKCLDEAKAAKAKADKKLAGKQKEYDEEKKAHEDTVIAHADDSSEKKEKCQQKQQDAREEGRKAGLQACPGVNGLMREIWRLRQKLGASEAAGGSSEEDEDEDEEA